MLTPPEICIHLGLRYGSSCWHLLRIMQPHLMLNCMVHKAFWRVSFHHNTKGTWGIALPATLNTYPTPLCELFWAPLCLDSFLCFITWKGRVDDGSGNLPRSSSPTWGRRYIIPLMSLKSKLHYFISWAWSWVDRVPQGPMSTCFLTTSPCSPAQKEGVFGLFLISSSNVK